jgi:transposase
MSYEFLPYDPDQMFLFPPSPQDWLPEDHLAYRVIDVVNEFDLSAFFSSYGKDGRGAPGFSPVLMCTLLLYAWIRKVYSSRKVSALCRDDVGGRVIGSGYLPDHRTINNFRLRHQAALNDFFKQSVKLCQRAGMIDQNESALDGSKIAANASKRKAMSYERMVAEEARLQAEIDGYFKRAAEEDAAEDAEHGPDNAGPTISEELKRRQSRIAKIREAKAALEAEAKAAAEAKQKERAEKEAKAAQAGQKVRGKQPTHNPEPKSTAQRSFTDPESRIMKGGNGSFMQAYNAQAVVNGKAQVVTACGVSQQPADVVHFADMLDGVKANTGEFPKTVLADPGYFSEENMTAAADRGVTALIPPDRQRHGSPSEPVEELSDEELAALPAIERMRHLVSTQAGRDAYRKRKGIVEPVFGQIKGGTGNPGFLGFLRRGFEKCSAEWQWACAAHNIQKYIRFKVNDNKDREAKPLRKKQAKRHNYVSVAPNQQLLCL